MNGLRTGGEIDSLCTRCKMVLAHTIIAMVGQKPARVQCNTCGGQHNFRSTAPASRPVATTSKTPAKTSSPRARSLTFDELLAQHAQPSRPYSPKVRFLVDESISHPTFGRGIVSAVREDKIDVTFRGGVRTLVHART